MGRISQFINNLPAQARAVVSTCLYGVSAGGITVAFELGMLGLFNLLYVRHLFTWKPVPFLAGSLVLLVGISAFVGWLVNFFQPEAAGGGIAKLKVAFWRNFGEMPVSVVVVKFFAGIINIGGGGSMGPEGPSAQLGAAMASTLAGGLGEAKQRRRLPAAAGAAAALAAAFNTPLAAVTFVLEEVINDLNTNLLGAVLLASALGAIVVHLIRGSHPAFAVSTMDDPGWRTNLISPLAALVAAIMGVGFQKCTLALRARLKSVPAGRAWMKPVVGGLVTWAAGAVVFLTTRRTGVYGIGYEDIQSALQGSFVWEVALLLLAAKFLATSACCGSDGNGGIFAPTLYMGTMCGVALAGLAEKFVPLAPASHTALALVGMSAFLGAVMRAPVTGILLVLEMTWDYSLLPGLMVAALVSQAVSRTLLKHGFYDAILEQDGVHLEQVMPPRDLRRWLAWPVASVANFHPVTVGDFKPETLRALLDRHTYAYFPVVREGRLEGVLARAEMAAALHEAREPRPATAPACAASASLREAQAQLLSSTTNLLLVVENERLLGLLTLHDLLRAQTNLADQN